MRWIEEFGAAVELPISAPMPPMVTPITAKSKPPQRPLQASDRFQEFWARKVYPGEHTDALRSPGDVIGLDSARQA